MDDPDQITLPETIIRGSAPPPAVVADPAPPSILDSILLAAKKLPGQTVGGLVDLSNTILGGAANIVDTIRGQAITRDIGEGLVPRPVGGTEQLNDLFGIPNKSSGLTEDSASAVLGAISPGAAAAKLGTAGKALIVGATSFGRDAAEINAASRALSNGVDPAFVFKNTGMYEGPIDGKMRTVINDNSAHINTSVIDGNLDPDGNALLHIVGSHNLDDVLGHPKIFDIYPELADTTIKSNLSYPPGNAAIMPPVNGKPGVITLGPMTSMDQLKSAILHETQHAIQSIEGFAGGGSATNFLPGYESFNKSFAKIQDIAGQLRDSVATKFGISPGTVVSYATASPSTIPADIRASDDFQTYLKTRNAQAVAINTKSAALQSYKNLGGEAESRAVQEAFRLGQTDETMFFPLDLYDVNPKTVIENPLVKSVKKAPTP